MLRLHNAHAQSITIYICKINTIYLNETGVGIFQCVYLKMFGLTVSSSKQTKLNQNFSSTDLFAIINGNFFRRPHYIALNACVKRTVKFGHNQK